MSIQKITNAMQSNPANKPVNHNEAAGSEVKIQRNDTSLKNSDAIKNSFLSGISFKGYTKEISTRNGYRDYYGTSGSLGRLSSISRYDIEHPEATKVTEGKKGYDVQTPDIATVSVYYADPGETITDDIKDRHAYIVEYDEPPIKVSEEDIEKAQTTSELAEILDNLKTAKVILEAKNKAKAQEADKAREIFEAAEERYNKAKQAKAQKAAEKEAVEIELFDINTKIDMATEKYEKEKRREEEEYLAAERVRTLTDMKRQLQEINSSNDEALIAIEAQIQAYIDAHNVQPNE